MFEFKLGFGLAESCAQAHIKFEFKLGFGFAKGDAGVQIESEFELGFVAGKGGAEGQIKVRFERGLASAKSRESLGSLKGRGGFGSGLAGAGGRRNATPKAVPGATWRVTINTHAPISRAQFPVP
jgi:hypothetical protein